MKEADRRRIEERLQEERAEAVEALGRADETMRISTEDDGELTQYDNHPADEGTDTQEQEKQLMLLGKEGELLNKVDDALRRLYKEPESFGKCENCGSEISMERLELVPWTTRCMKCEEQAEQGG